MAEALVSVVVEQLATILIAKAKREVKLVSEVGNEFYELKSRLESIRTLLADAGEKQISEKNIKLWLDRFKQACYDMEDVLDEWNTASLMLQKGEADQKSFSPFKGKVCRPFNSCFSFDQYVQHRGIALKIKEISDRLNVIAMDKVRFQLAQRDITQSRREESTSYTELSEFHGRDKDMKDLVNSLLCGGSDPGRGESDAKTIFVVGMGGVGKTALVRLVFRDGEVMEHFDHRIWVSVAEVSDENRVAKEIIVSFDHVSAQELGSASLGYLVEKIWKYIQRKKVLLVLDDVWTDERSSWESLNEAFKHAAPESRILVTTRKETVVGTMKSFRVFYLKQLNEEDCWKILRQDAFAGKTEEQRKSLEDMGRKIAEKCSGLPLVAKVIGSVLLFRETREEWEYILNSDEWNLCLRDVFAALRLSYYDLPAAVKRCFLYCSIFPKGFEIKKDDLIYQWMAQGYLSHSEHQRMEIIGDQYFQCLVARSFFQDLEKHEHGSITCKIHDIVVDFVRHLMGKELEFKELHTVDNLTVQLSPEETNHLSVTLAGHRYFPSSILGAEKLRSLNIFKIDDEEEEEETGEDLSNLFIKAKHLRLLNFHGGTSNTLKDTIPKEIGNLIHLRHLNLSGNHKIKGLPGSLCDLHNLQYLRLDNCKSLENLPDDIGNLIHLMHLDLSGNGKIKGLPGSLCDLHNLQCLRLDNCESLENLPDDIGNLINLIYLGTLHCYRLACYPKSAGRLTKLRQLCGIVLRADRNDSKEFALGDLEKFDNLCVLSMVLKGNAVDDRQLKRAKFENKTHLKEIKVQ